MFRAFLSILALAVALPLSSVSRAAESVDYSGMVRIAGDSFLIVSDPKNRGAYQETNEPRLGIVTVTKKGASFLPLEVADWRDPDGVPNDLEACCAVPGREGEYLLAESGRFKNRFGRIFHIRVTREGEGPWAAACLGVLRLSYGEPDANGSTPDGKQIEGIACVQTQEKKRILVLGQRGANGKEGSVLGKLVWGELDLASYQFTKSDESDIVAKSILESRDCSELLLEPAGEDQWTIWSVAARDIDSNIGPFRSVIYRAGTLVADSKRGVVRFDREATPVIRYELDGLKVEALAAPAHSIPDSVLSIGTDDENFGGIWRPLFPKP